jgi:hypothetical protein
VSAPTQDVMDWIAGLGWDTRQELGYPLGPGPYVPPAPDRIVVITNTGGPGFVTEEMAADAVNFQARLRGAPEDPCGAEEAAYSLDQMIMSGMTGGSVLAASRVGSGPVPLPFDPTDQRTEYTASYTIVMGA